MITGSHMAAPLLSITMPTRNRPGLFERALGSVLRAMAPVAEQVEITVSDGSDDEATGQVAQRLLTGWPGGHRYVRNQPALELTANMNRAVELASGVWVQQLDDDDYLLPGAGMAMINAIRTAGPDEAVLVFGAEIVDAAGVRQREQRFLRERYLTPREALRRLLRNSSFVREPMVVVRSSALQREGLFDTTVGGACDTDMWVRLFSRYGVRCVPQSTCAYTIHEAAATTGMWNPDTIRHLCAIFDRAARVGVVPERTIRRWQAAYFHQFILAGAYRRLRVRRRVAARRVLELFDLPEVRELGASPKWLFVRAAFMAATVGAHGGE
jgi:glycosyltransferase involved in cell wall biosynthesis